MSISNREFNFSDPTRRWGGSFERQLNSGYNGYMHLNGTSIGESRLIREYLLDIAFCFVPRTLYSGTLRAMKGLGSSC